MSQGPADYAGRLTKEEEEKIMQMRSPEEISSFLHQREVAAGLRVPDILNGDVLHEIDRSMLAATPQPVSVTIAGKTYSGTQQEVDAAIAERFRQSDAQPARNANGTFAKTEPTPTPSSVTAAANKIANTVVNDALAAEGISIDDLREFSAGRQMDRREVVDWGIAAERFKAGPGADWPGGEDNREILGDTLALLGLGNATDKVAALTEAWTYMKRSMKQHEDVTNAETPAQLREALGITERERMRVRNGNPW
jgi:hypothetical protein